MPVSRKYWSMFCVVVSVVALCRTDSFASRGQPGPLAYDGTGLDGFTTAAGRPVDGAAGGPLFALEASDGPCGDPFLFETASGGDDSQAAGQEALEEAESALPPLFGPDMTAFAAPETYPGGAPNNAFPVGAFGIAGPAPAGNGKPPGGSPGIPPGLGHPPGFGGSVPSGNGPGFNDIPAGPIGNLPPGTVTPTPGQDGSPGTGGPPPSGPIATLPEPTSIAVLGLGLAGIVVLRRRRAIRPRRAGEIR